MTTAAIIVAAGKGERAGQDMPKQFALLGGKALVAHSALRMTAHGSIDHVLVVIGADQRDLLNRALGSLANVTVVEGGAERQDSVRNGLAAAQSLGCSHVLIHDAARPFVSGAVIDRLIAALETNDGAVPALPVVDTLARGEGVGLGDPVDRTGVHHIQTPQAFALPAIINAHQRWTGSAATDDAQMARAAGYGVALVEGENALAKITHPADFARMEAMLQSNLISRTGMGYDVHRLEAGEELWLCGVRIPHDRGLAGHSDADVAIHALVDAILGALADGDIGTHFPPSDPQWRGAASSRFLEHAAGLVAARGGLIDHVDVTLICEAPKIGPHRAAMRATLARLLGVDEWAVSIKATTTERLGFAGRGEGIAAQAIATLRLPLKGQME